MRAAYWVLETHLFRADEYICSSCGSSADEPYQVCPAYGMAMKKVRNGASWVDEAEGLSAFLDGDW